MKNFNSTQNMQNGWTEKIAQKVCVTPPWQTLKGLLDSDKEQVTAQNKFGFASRFGQFLPQSQGTVNMCNGPI